MTGASSGDGASKPGRFGTFGGVFTPSILTILGVVMYMRLGAVTGEAGLGVALGIIVVSHLISAATGLSVSSIATNRTVGAGGAYFMISRALGGAAGASIGIPLFFAQALSVTFYIVGFSESVLQLIPPEWQTPVLAPLIGTVINVLITGLSLWSAELAIKAQYVVMLAIAASLVALFTGGLDTGSWTEIEWLNQSENAAPPAEIFATFFPAVTGIMAGVSMSGDLKDSRKSLPVGTMAAIAVGFVVYMAIPVWLAAHYDNAFLATHPDVVFRLASVPALIYVGVWGATLSSALGSVLTAPRTLQALAVDGLMPRFLGKGYGPNNEPRVGVILTFFMAQTGIFLGDLDAIAPILTMFFLATYGVTNLACGLQRWAASPSFRPRFRVPAWLSLSGGAACFYVMSLISLSAMIVALLLCGLIFTVAQRRALDTTYGDARHGLWAALVRSALHRLRRVEFHPINWRPNLIIFGGDPKKRPHLLHLGSSLVQDRGVVTYFQLLKGRVAELAEKRRTMFAELDPLIQGKFANVFFRVEVVRDLFSGTVNAAQSYGVGAFEANAVMLGWTGKAERRADYARMLQELVLLERALLLVRYHPEKKLGEGRELHVWLHGDERTRAMLLLFAHLLTAHYRWRNREITVFDIADNDEDRAAAREKLTRLLEEARIEARPRVLLRQGRTRAELMHVESETADFALVGIALPEMTLSERGDGEPTSTAAETSEEDGALEEFMHETDAVLAELPTTILIHAPRSFAHEHVLLDRE